MPFKVTIDGQSWLAEDLTLDETVEIEKETGQSWLYHNPIRSATLARAIMVRFLAREHGLDEARLRVGSMSVKAALDSVESVEDDDRPKEHVDGMPVVDPKGRRGGRATT